MYPRILYQAFILSVFKKVKHKAKPILKGAGILRQKPITTLQKHVIKKLQFHKEGIHSGKLLLNFPDKSQICLGKDQPGTYASIDIHDLRFLDAIIRQGGIGLGESFMTGYWTSSNLEAVIGFMVENIVYLNKSFRGHWLLNVLYNIQRYLRKNSHHNSKKNISDHYDLGNSFYKLFLDKTMMYSSGLFKDPLDSLDKAQQQKVSRLILGLQLKPTDHVLEIGSGWGYTAIQIAKTYGCKVTSITLSEEQLSYVKQCIYNEGLEELVCVELKDYRKVKGQYDAIISIEMIEAVGKEYLNTYFKTCHNVLKPGGIFALQAITYPDQYYKLYCDHTDFIQKHIFPGGHLPSLKVIEKAINTYTSFKPLNSLNIATSYAQTLKLWREQFFAQKSQLNGLGFNESFINKWMYYFSYCEAAFARNFLGCYQFHYQKQA